MPRDEEEIAFAPAWAQACWIRDGATTSAELTDLALRRLDDASALLERYLIRKANEVLSRNVELGPWIHVSSDVQYLGTVADGDELAHLVAIAESKAIRLAQ